MREAKKDLIGTQYDVAIIGGGPAGSTTGTLLRKYNPNLKVLILERELFPREHVGESGLPSIPPILNEMGCWDKIEAANFPIKIGATYRWGRSPELWHVDFIPVDQFKDEPRPAKFEGLRLSTAFQVDRAIYDEILLDHAAEMGCEVREQTKVAGIEAEGDRITSLGLATGEQIKARYYIDASGNSAIMRRAMDVKVDYPSTLQNIAIWEYWQNADWAFSVGVGGTRIQVLSLGYGWIWFIPVGPTRTSIGLVVPAEYFKEKGDKPRDLYTKALKEEAIVGGLIANATSEGKTFTTRDWSFLAERQAGENWFLIGESAGFADPILSAGMSMAHASGREVAFTILELDRGKEDAAWLKERFEDVQSNRIRTHIRFADYWYTANSQFKDLKAFTAQLATDVGLDLSPEKAWDWLSFGGFINAENKTGMGGFSLTAVKKLGKFLSDLDAGGVLTRNNVFELDLTGATLTGHARYVDGEVKRLPCYVRGKRSLPMQGAYNLLLEILKNDSKLPAIMARLKQFAEPYKNQPEVLAGLLHSAVQGLEALVLDGWVRASYDPALPLAHFNYDASFLRWDKDVPAAPKGKH